jgi:small subunit ribosomal protein S21
MENPSSSTVHVVNGNLNAALKAFKKCFTMSGTYREMKRRRHFEKPSTRRRAKHREALQRTLRAAFRRLQKESVS